MDNQSDHFNRRDYFLVFIGFLLVIVNPLTADNYTPSLPAITKALGSTINQIQLTMTLYLVGVAFSQLIYGPLADKYGRRPIILIGIIIAIIGSILCSVADSLNFILFARLIQGSGAGVCNSLFRAVMRDSFTGSKLAQAGSYTGMCFTVVYAIAPIIGGYIQFYLGWRANFIFSASMISIIFILLYVFLAETHLNKDPHATRWGNILRNYLSLLSSVEFVGYTLISGLAFSGFIAYFTAAPFILQNVVGLTPVEFGWMSFSIAVGIFIGQFLNVRMVVVYGVDRMLLIGIFIMLIGGSMMLIAALAGYINAYVIVVPVVVFSISSGIVFSSAMANAFHAFGHIAGVAGAMYGFIQILCSALTSIVVAILPEHSQLPLAVVFTALGISTLSLYYLLSKIKNPQ